eukprot:3086902-Prymnesium_polylepis.1
MVEVTATIRTISCSLHRSTLRLAGPVAASDGTGSAARRSAPPSDGRDGFTMPGLACATASNAKQRVMQPRQKSTLPSVHASVALPPRPPATPRPPAAATPSPPSPPSSAEPSRLPKSLRGAWCMV